MLTWETYEGKSTQFSLQEGIFWLLCMTGREKLLLRDVWVTEDWPPPHSSSDQYIHGYMAVLKSQCISK